MGASKHRPWRLIHGEFTRYAKISPGTSKRGPLAWETYCVTDAISQREWLSIPALVDLLDLTPSRIRRLIEDKHLLAIRHEGVLSVPADFLRDGEPLVYLRGTLFLLEDAGFSTEEAMSWLLEVDDALGVAPIDALNAGRKTEVRRVAQALA
ncbi:DNA-binding protein [Mycetocola spongiae]|nr:DNA-binding protein [Mycetocola spongiae]